jgi:hypothetical protein
MAIVAVAQWQSPPAPNPDEDPFETSYFVIVLVFGTAFIIDRRIRRNRVPDVTAAAGAVMCFSSGPSSRAARSSSTSRRRSVRTRGDRSSCVLGSSPPRRCRFIASRWNHCFGVPV